MEVLPGIHRVEGRFGGRYLFQHVLVGQERVLLVDTGIATTPDELLFPYLEGIGRSPAEISYVVCTHPDTDHFGGNGAIRRAARACRFLAHELDVAWLEDPDRMVRERYDGLREEHGIHETDDVLRELRELCGDPVEIDVALAGGEWVNLGNGWRVQVLHVPGHSEGHLGVWDDRSRALITTDAAMGRALPFVDGSPALAATYTHPSPYARSSERLEQVGAEHLLTAHFPLMSGEDVARFLDDTRDHVETTEALLVDLIRRSERPLTLKELIGEVDRTLGPLPEATTDTWAPPLAGHLAELEASGAVVASWTAEGRKAWSPS